MFWLDPWARCDGAKLYHLFVFQNTEIYSMPYLSDTCEKVISHKLSISGDLPAPRRTKSQTLPCGLEELVLAAAYVHTVAAMGGPCQAM